jgi:hypothetical protein
MNFGWEDEPRFMAAAAGSEPKNRRVEFFSRYIDAEEWCSRQASIADGYRIYALDPVSAVDVRVFVTRLAPRASE